MLDRDMKAQGDILFDDGQTPDMTLNSYIKFEAVGENRLIGKDQLTITFTIVNGQSTKTQSESQNFSRLILYKANNMGLGETTEVTIRHNGQESPMVWVPRQGENVNSVSTWQTNDSVRLRDITEIILLK